MNERRTVCALAIVALLIIGLAWLLMRDDAVEVPEVVTSDVASEPAEQPVELLSGVPDALRKQKKPPAEKAPKSAKETTNELMGMLGEKQTPRVQPVPSKEQLDEISLYEPAPPGVLIGAVFDGKEPFSDGEAVVWMQGKSFGANGIPAGEKPIRAVSLGSDGVFRVDGLEPGYYYVGVRARGGPPRLGFHKLLVGPKPSPKALFVLGTGRLFGTVYDDQGRPATHVWVRASMSGTAGRLESTSIQQVRTDRDGSYSFDLLRAGGGWLSVAYSGNFNDDATTPSRKYSLRVGQERRIDIGTPHGLRTLRGNIVTAGGVPFRGPGKIIISGGASRGYVVTRYAEDGTFSQKLAPGEYNLAVMFPDPTRQPTSGGRFNVRIGEEDASTTITIPGTRLTGRVHDRGGRAPRATNGVTWRTPKSASLRLRGSARIRGDGTYTIDGLPPATYLLRAPGNEVEVEVVIRPGDERVAQDLETP